jgi:hypothetical protein
LFAKRPPTQQFCTCYFNIAGPEVSSVAFLTATVAPGFFVVELGNWRSITTVRLVALPRCATCMPPIAALRQARTKRADIAYIRQYM